MLEDTLTIDETVAAASERIAASRITPIVYAPGNRGEPREPAPTGPGDVPSTAGSQRPLRRWSVAELIASAHFANDR